MTTDPYRCYWCGEYAVIPSLARDHETRCPERPEDQ